jgi:hypothetical protein
MRSASLFACAAAILLCSCTPPTQYPAPAKKAIAQTNVPAQPPVQRERLAYLAGSAQDPVACTTGADCTEKWSRALSWVFAHSQYSVKTSTESEITTYGPIEPTTDAGYSITKTSEGPTAQAIHFGATCGDKAACVPTVLEQQADFKNYLVTGVRQGGDY